VILRDGNGAIYPLAKDNLEGVRDPMWLDMLPLRSLGMGIQSIANVGPAFKNQVAVIALALRVCTHCLLVYLLIDGCNVICIVTLLIVDWLMVVLFIVTLSLYLSL